eukprot:177600-Amphidinium_carterae.1
MTEIAKTTIIVTTVVTTIPSNGFEGVEAPSAQEDSIDSATDSTDQEASVEYYSSKKQLIISSDMFYVVS